MRQVVIVSGLALALALPARADQVINDDLIVQGGICTGFDCVDGEDFSNDTLILKENNTRLSFGPSENIAMAANQSSSGGLNQFSIGQGATNPAARISFTQTGDGVTLGFNSTSVTGAVSVGATGSERQVKQVADGVANTDLVNLRQMNTVIAARTSAVDALQAAIAARAPAAGNPFDAEAGRLHSVSAMTAALSALQPNPRATGPFQFSIGLGVYEGETAAAAGVSWRANDLTLVKFGVAKSGDSDTKASLSLNFSW